MEYSELIAARYSVRAYRPDPLEDEKLQAVLEAGHDVFTVHWQGMPYNSGITETGERYAVQNYA